MSARVLLAVLTLATVLLLAVIPNPGRAVTDASAPENINLTVVSYYITYSVDPDDWEKHATIVGEVQNIGTSIVKDISVSADYYDSGILIADHDHFDEYFPHLRPGQKTPIYSYVEIPFWSTITEVDWYLTGLETSEEPFEPPVELLHTESYSGGRFSVRGGMRSLCNCNMALEYIVGTFYNQQGEIRDIDLDRPTYAFDWILRPGETVPFVVGYDEREPTGSYELRVLARVTRAQPLPFAFADVSIWLDQYGALHLSGRVTNEGPVVAEDVVVLGTLYDSENIPISYQTDWLWVDLNPGQAEDFDVEWWLWGEPLDYETFTVEAQAETVVLGPTCTPETPTPTPTSTPTMTPSPTPTLPSTPVPSPTSTPTPVPGWLPLIVVKG